MKQWKYLKIRWRTLVDLGSQWYPTTVRYAGTVGDCKRHSLATLTAPYVLLDGNFQCRGAAGYGVVCVQRRTGTGCISSPSPSPSCLCLKSSHQYK